MIFDDEVVSAGDQFLHHFDEAEFACPLHEFDVRWPSAHRRHGDPFPLPRHGRPMTASQLTRRVDASYGALNHLAAAVFDVTKSQDLPLTFVQTWMMKDLHRRVNAYGDKPVDLDENQALHDLTSNANLYNQEAMNIAEYDINEIKILQRRLTPLSAKELAPLEARSYLEHFELLVERSPQELEALRQTDELVKPHWDERLKQSKVRRMELYKRLFDCGLLTFRRREKARVGMFTVRKKGNRQGNTQRLIVDCRQANHLMRRPPTTRLATPSGLAMLDLTNESLVDAGFSVEDFSKGHISPSLETGDVGDCFCNFAIKEACSWFSTGDFLTTDEMDEHGMMVHEIYDDDMGYDTPINSGEKLFICFGGMPMGWSWALYFAQEIICEQCIKACEETPDRLIRDKHPPPKVEPEHPALGIYVDNVHAFGGTSQDSELAMRKIQEHFSSLGIPFDVDSVSGDATVDTLGMTFDFSGGKVVVRAKRDRTWRLWGAIRAVLRRRRISGDCLRVLIGHINFHFLLARPLLSTLSACYAFASNHIGNRFPMWPAVRKELKIVLGLLFTVERDLSSRVNSTVHVGDSSDRGFGLMATQADSRHVKHELRHQEKWRFLVSREPHFPSVGNGSPDQCLQDDASDSFRGSAPDAGVGTRTRYGLELQQKLQEAERTTIFPGLQRKDRSQEKPTPTTILQVHSIPEVSERWSDPTRWDLIASGPWERLDEHINVKEARVALMSLRRLSRSVANMNSTCLTLCDNLVSVMMFEKGRSGVGVLNTLCKRSAAYQIGANIIWRLRHIKSECNVADGPSRQWGADVPRGVLNRGGGKEISLGDHNIIDSLEQGISQPSSSSSTACPSHRRLEGPGNMTGVLELFAGTGRWTQAMEKAGLRAFPGFELANGKQYDILNSNIQDIVLSLIRGGLVWLVHLGTPCTAWSRARHGIRNVAKARYKEQLAVATAIFSCRVIRECLKHGVAFTLENPLSSRLWEFKPIQDILSHKNVCMVVFDHCCYGMPYKKSTGLMTNTPQFKILGLRCCGGHKHVQLKGTETVTNGNTTTTRNRTAGAGAYPTKLCRLWAQIARQIGPSGCRVKMSRWEREAFDQLLNEATHSRDRQNQKLVDVPDHPTWKGEAGCDTKLLTEAKDFIKTHPVVFGQFTKQDIAREFETKAQRGHAKNYQQEES